MWFPPSQPYHETTGQSTLMIQPFHEMFTSDTSVKMEINQQCVPSWITISKPRAVPLNAEFLDAWPPVSPHHPKQMYQQLMHLSQDHQGELWGKGLRIQCMHFIIHRSNSKMA